MRVLVLWFALATGAYAQLTSMKLWRFQLSNGALVSFISGEALNIQGSGSYTIPDLLGDAVTHDNTIEHVIEERGQKVLAYRLRIEPTGEAEYIATIEPVAGAPFFLQAPKPLRIQDGQHAEIDLATTKDGYVKAVASIQITKYERRFSSIPAMWSSAQDLSLEALHVRVHDAEIFKNNRLIGEHAGGASGGTIVAYLPGIGRVLFSLIPQKGFDFQKTAVVEDNRILFDIGPDHYEIASSGSVIGQPGPWRIYMLRAADTTPCQQSIDPSRPAVWGRTLTADWLICEAGTEK